MKYEVNMYDSISRYEASKPDASLVATDVKEENEFLYIVDEEGYKHIVNMRALYAVTYKEKYY